MSPAACKPLHFLWFLIVLLRSPFFSSDTSVLFDCYDHFSVCRQIIREKSLTNHIPQDTLARYQTYPCQVSSHRDSE